MHAHPAPRQRRRTRPANLRRGLTPAPLSVLVWNAPSSMKPSRQPRPPPLSGTCLVFNDMLHPAIAGFLSVSRVRLQTPRGLRDGLSFSPRAPRGRAQGLRPGRRAINACGIRTPARVPSSVRPEPDPSVTSFLWDGLFCPSRTHAGLPRAESWPDTVTPLGPGRLAPGPVEVAGHVHWGEMLHLFGLSLLSNVS